MTFDYYEIDPCHGCRHAKMKEDGTFGLFPRRYGCRCQERMDFDKRGKKAISDIQDRDYSGAIKILNDIMKDKYSFDIFGWIEPYDNPICCPFKKEKN